MTKQIEEKVKGSDAVAELKAPRAVPFILSNIFLERFSTGGITGETNSNATKREVRKKSSSNSRSLSSSKI